MAQPLAQAEVCAPWSLQLWGALVNWLAFLFQIFVQIGRITPSMAQFLSYIGLRHSFLSSSSPSFKPLPVVELPLADPPPPPPPEVAPAHADVNDIADGACDQGIEKLTAISEPSGSFPQATDSLFEEVRSATHIHHWTEFQSWHVRIITNRRQASWPYRFHPFFSKLERNQCVPAVNCIKLRTCLRSV